MCQVEDELYCMYVHTIIIQSMVVGINISLYYVLKLTATADSKTCEPMSDYLQNACIKCQL